MSPAPAPFTPEDLVELEAIRRLKYAYLRCLDQKRFDELGELLTDDCEARYGGGAYGFDGRDEIVAFLQRTMGTHDLLSSHQCHHPEIELTSPTTATGTWALEDHVILKAWNLTVHGAAFYEDEYVKGDDGRWRIARTGYRRSYEQLVPIPEGARLTADWWATDGRSELSAD